MLPYGRQQIDEADIEAVAAVLRGDFLTTGPMVEQFEQAFAAAVEAPYAVVCNSGTAALHLARTVTRRAERAMTALAAQEPLNPAGLAYINRLSDLLFALARMENEGGAADVLWVPGANR